MLEMQRQTSETEDRDSAYTYYTAAASTSDGGRNAGGHTLRRADLFAGLPPEDVRMFDTRCVWKSVQSGKWLLDPSDGGAYVYFLVRGRAQVIVASGSRELLLRDVREGDFAGELFAVGRMFNWIGIRAATNVLAARMSAAAFREAIERHPIVRDRVLEHLSSEVDHMLGKMVMMTTLGLRGRLSSQLLSLARPGSGGRLVVSPPPSHAELAARIGARRESVTKLLISMRNEGSLLRSRGALTIAAPDRLHAMIAADERKPVYS